jgi:hypothetical protein
MSDLMLSGIIVGLLAMLLWTPALMSIGVSKFEGDLSTTEKVLCCIPIVNIIRAEVKYYGKIRLVTISSITFIVACVLRVLAWWYLYDNVTIGTASIILFWGALAFWAVANMVFVYNVINDAAAMRGGKLLLFSIVFPFGQYYIGTYLANVIRHMQSREDTFKQ